MEKLFYEIKPFLCLAASIYVLQNQYAYGFQGAPIAKASGIILLVCAIIILYMRGHYRGYFK